MCVYVRHSLAFIGLHIDFSDRLLLFLGVGPAGSATPPGVNVYVAFLMQELFYCKHHGGHEDCTGSVVKNCNTVRLHRNPN